MLVTNEGLGWDSLLKMVHNPGADWNPWWGGTQITLVFYQKGSCFGGLKPKNRGETGSKYMLSTDFWFLLLKSEILHPLVAISYLN